MKTHDLKCWPTSFALIIGKVKRFDVRKADRNFEIGDVVVFEEFRAGVGEYTGKKAVVTIGYLEGPDDSGSAITDGIKPGYCVLGWGPVEVRS